MTSPITSARAPRAALIAMNPWVVTLVVLLHAVVTVLHGNAHTSLGVELSFWQRTYVLIVIVAAPFVAGVLAWTRWVRLALFVLLLSMAGSLIFGACYHYLIVSPDNVAHLPAGFSIRKPPSHFDDGLAVVRHEDIAADQAMVRDRSLQAI